MHSAQIENEYDVIVVGSGPGGSTIAARLAQYGINPKRGEKLRVAMFEWGPYHKGDPKRGYGIPSRRAAFDGMPYELSRRYMLPWGTLGMVGGSTHWAGMIAYPPEEIDFEHYRQESGVDWTWERFNHPLAEVREMWHPFPEPEGVHSPGQRMFRKAAEELGYDVHAANQAKLNCVRCGDCNGRVCKYDAKSTPLVNYVPIAERFGVKIFGQTPVEKVLIEKKGARAIATGVVYREGGQLKQAKAAAVVVAGGYNGTPRLLFRSGYGPRRKVQGELIVENENVGKNLVCSVNAGSISMLFGEPIVDPAIGTHGVWHISFPGRHGKHLVLVGEDMGSREGTRRYPEDRAMSQFAPEFGRELKEFMTKCTTHVGQIRVEISKTDLRGEIDGDGRVTFGETNVEEEDRGGVYRTYLLKHHPEILKRLDEGLDVARKIADHLKPLRMDRREEAAEVLSTNHNHGSCRAGASAENSVVNSDLESHDVDGLFIADASVIPFQGTANPGLPTATIVAYGWRRMVANHFS